MVAFVLRGAVRKEDVLARYGGEEFVVIARETALDGAQRARRADPPRGRAEPLRLAGAGPRRDRLDRRDRLGRAHRVRRRAAPSASSSRRRTARCTSRSRPAGTASSRCPASGRRHARPRPEAHPPGRGPMTLRVGALDHPRTPAMLLRVCRLRRAGGSGSAGAPDGRRTTAARSGADAVAQVAVGRGGERRPRGAGAIQVPAASGRRASSAAELAQLSQAERAERALAEGRRERQIPHRPRLPRGGARPAPHAADPRRRRRARASPTGASSTSSTGTASRAASRSRTRIPRRPRSPQEMRSIGFGPGWATPGAQAIRDRAPRLFREVTEEMHGVGDARRAAPRGAPRHEAELAPLRPARRARPRHRRDHAHPLDDRARASTRGTSSSPRSSRSRRRSPSTTRAGTRPSARRAAAAEELADRERADRLEAERAALRLRRLEALSASLSAALLPPRPSRGSAVESGLSLLEPSSADVVRASRVGRRPRGAARAGLARRPRPRAARAARRRAGARRGGVADPDARSGSPTRRRSSPSHPSAAGAARRLGDAAWAARAAAGGRADGRRNRARLPAPARPRRATSAGSCSPSRSSSRRRSSGRGCATG